MPYIPIERREEIKNGAKPRTVGELNYKYSDLNAVMGVLGAVKSEFYRRMVAKYEDFKIAENGDVFYE